MNSLVFYKVVTTKVVHTLISYCSTVIVSFEWTMAFSSNCSGDGETNGGIRINLASVGLHSENITNKWSLLLNHLFFLYLLRGPQWALANLYRVEMCAGLTHSKLEWVSEETCMITHDNTESTIWISRLVLRTRAVCPYFFFTLTPG